MDLFKFGTLFALYTGIRNGELYVLQWEDVSLQSATLKVQKTLQRIQDTTKEVPSRTKIVITEPKSKCPIRDIPRDIPIPKFFAEIAHQFSNCPKAYILTGDKLKYTEPRTVQNHFKIILIHAELNAPSSMRCGIPLRIDVLSLDLK